MKPEHDDISGQDTTGHDWDGIKELNTPVPRTFLVVLWGSIAVCLVLWILYPAWPYFSDYSKGLLGYSSRTVVTTQVTDGKAARAQAFAPFETGDVAELAQDASLRATYEPSIKVLYNDNCAACHGRDLKGQNDFPNLTDDHWLWSGTPEGIEYTLQVGINAVHDESQYGQMPAFGREKMLERDEIKDVVEYVLQIAGSDHMAEAAQRGEEIFADNCSSCHEENGVGGMENGAPSLVDAAWIYGGQRDEIALTLKNGRAGVMPSWSGRLSEAEIRMLTLYVLWAGDDDG